MNKSLIPFSRTKLPSIGGENKQGDDPQNSRTNRTAGNTVQQVTMKQASQGDEKLTFTRNPEETAGLLSRWTFAYQYPLFKLAKKKAEQGHELEPEDIFPLREQDMTKNLIKKFERFWGKGQEKGHEGAKLLIFSLGNLIRAAMSWSVVMLLVRSAVRFCYPVLVSLFLSFVTTEVQDESQLWKGYLYSFLLALNTIAATLLKSQVDHLMLRSGLQTRSVLSTAIFRKTLALNQVSRASTTTGEILNYMHLDTNRIDQFVRWCPSVVSNVAEVILFAGLTIYFIGYAALAGLAILLASIPLNKWVIKKIYRIDARAVKHTDARVKVTNETMQEMLGVKSAAWEEKFMASIGSLRSREIGEFKQLRVYRSLIEMMIGAVPSFTAAVAVATYSLAIGGPISAPILFSTIISFERIRLPLVQVPNLVNSGLQSFTSAKRVSAFLSLPQVDIKDYNPLDETKLDPDCQLEIRDGTFYWSAETDTAQGTNASDGVKTTRVGKKSQKLTKDDGKRDAIRVPVLTDINVKFKTGKITSVLGPVGCGKTALTQVLLGEMYRDSGHITIRGNARIAYCAQDPWILNATILDNITFGEPVDEERLKAVVQVCQLEQDLKVLPAGIATMIGEKGINLSGGQKARLSIARAAYSTAPIVVMDSPLSALDPGVAGKLFDQCISKFMSGCTRILVTHQLHVLQHCDWVVVIGAVGQHIDESGNHISVTGRIQEQGTFTQLLSDGLEFAILLEEFQKTGQGASARKQSSSPSVDGSNPVSARKQSSSPSVDGSNPAEGVIDNMSLNDELRESIDEQRGSNEEDADQAATVEAVGLEQPFDDKQAGSQDAASDKLAAAGGKLMTVEERARGAVTFSTYGKYIDACGGWPIMLVVVLVIALTRGAGFMSLKWVSFWTTSARTNYTTVDPLPSSIVGEEEIGTSVVPLVIFSLGYLGFTILELLMSFVTNFAIMTFALKAAMRVHQELLQRVFGSPMSFFDTTPIGRIMNRFSKDLSVLDQEIQGYLYFFTLAVSFTVTSLIVLIATMPLFAVTVVPFSIVYWVVLRLFRPVNRDVKRLEAISRSPLYANFSETIGGTSTIRAYQAVDRFLARSEGLVDDVTRFMAMRYITNWLRVRLELLGTVGIALIGILAIQGSRAGWLEAGDVGLSFQYVDTMAIMIQHTLFSYAKLEAAMTSVERVFYYRDMLEQERPREPESSSDGTVLATPKEWPSKGEIKVRNLRMRYRKDTPLILKGVTFSVKGGERVGICGRTGSGKSSLIKSLLRLVEPELDHDNKDSGPIELDGIDICKIGLGPLRRAISVVSQDPTIFSGPIRINLDPFDEYSDADIWIALEKCGLKTFVQEAPGKLQMQVSEFGTNLSQGQRQLLVLARCLLENSKVLLLDESTASLDFETDSKIQDVLRSTFTECTVLVIAHRIRTILDSDKILVMDDGKVAEYDTPVRLLANRSSKFYGMAKGQAVAAAGARANE